MISCKQATKLISRAMEEPLSVKDELLLKVHLFVCEFCQQFKLQVQALKRAMQADPPESGGGMSQEAKEELKERLRRDRES